MKYLAILLLFVGCAGTMKTGEKKKLEKAHKAATEAEKRLSELRQERIQLEKELNQSSEEIIE